MSEMRMTDRDNESISRKVSIAPMMDWTDWNNSSREINNLCGAEKYRSLSVASPVPLRADSEFLGRLKEVRSGSGRGSIFGF
jgi:hypothetical protein